MTCPPLLRAGLVLTCTWMLTLAACGDGGGSPDTAPDAAPRPEPDAIQDDNAALADLRISRGTLTPVFAPHVTSYSMEASLLVTELALTPTADSDAASIAINGAAAASGQAAEPIPLDVGENDITIEVTAEAGNTQTYRVTVTRTADAFDQRYTKSEKPLAGEQFGTSVAVASDYLAVGVPFESGVDPQDPDGGNLAQSGAVYVFRRSGTVWSLDAYLKADNPDTGDNFGVSVALDGDTLAVGATGESSGDAANPDDNGAIDSGAVYVFRRGEAGWQQEAYLKAANLGGNDRFGTSVALSGDTLAVGATGESSGSAQTPDDNSARNSGAAYVFRRSGGDWQQEAYLKAANLDAFDELGTSIALDGDVLAVGAPGEDSARQDTPEDDTASGSGAVYVFRRSGSEWQQETYLKAANTGSGDAFGTSVGLSGDVLVAGAPGEDSGDPDNGNNNSASNSGAVYSFQHTGAGWSQRSYLKASNLDDEDGFGTSVAVHGSVLAVGAPGEDSADPANPDNDAASGSGAVYFFLGDGGVWTQQAYLKAAIIDSSDSFGASVAVTTGALAAGATGESSGMKVSPYDNSAPQSGAVYLFE